MKITTLTKDELIVDVPRRGTTFLVLVCLFCLPSGAALIIAGAKGGGFPPILAGAFLSLIGGGGLLELWQGGAAQFRLDRRSGTGTIHRSYPFKRTRTQSFALEDVDDVLTADKSQQNGRGLTIEFKSGETLKVVGAIHTNPEALKVGEQIRNWLKEAGNE